MGKSPSINHKYVEIPSLEEIADMEKQRQDAIESLEISNGLVKCQGRCGALYPIIKKSDATTSSNSYRIARLQSMIKQSEKVKVRGYSCKNERQELADLLKEEEKMNVLRKLPFCSSRLTDYKWYCSNCYDEVEKSRIINKKKS